MLAAPDTILADSAAQILLQRPASLDVKALIANFDVQPPRTRRLYCVLLGSVAQQTDAAGKLLLRTTQDVDDGVRWQAALAIGYMHGQNDHLVTTLLSCLKDTNQFVAAAAVHSLARLGATNIAPALLIKLKAQIDSNSSDEERQSQAKAITHDMKRSLRPVGGYSGGLPNILDPDNLSLRMDRGVPATAKRMATLRLPPRPINFPTHNYNLTDALIEALGDLGYTPAANELFKLQGTDYDAAATRALRKLAPEQLASELLNTAKDKQIDSYVREQALVTLCNISATNHVRDLIPLLDDTTPIVYSRALPGPEWRICDRAAETIAILMGWENRPCHSFTSGPNNAKR